MYLVYSPFFEGEEGGLDKQLGQSMSLPLELDHLFPLSKKFKVLCCKWARFFLIIIRVDDQALRNISIIYSKKGIDIQMRRVCTALIGRKLLVSD